MNIKQKNKKQNCVTIGVYLLIHPAAGVLFDFKGVTEGLIMEAEKQKNKTRRNSIKNRKRKSKKVLGKLNGTRSITFSDLFNCLI
jgi:hypothetical protein